MAIPDYETIMLPLMKLGSDKKEHSLREAIDKLATEFNLSTEERRRLLPSGKQEVFDNRVGWARTYLKKAGLVEITRWGYFRITGRGVDVLRQNPSNIDVKLLSKFKEFRDFKSIRREKPVKERKPEGKEERTPKEELDYASQSINDEIAEDVLQRLMAVSPGRFEHIVIELLVKMGYGGSYRDAAQAIGGVGDEGVDGVINEDRLGLNRIYVQAKRWQNKYVGHPEIRNFVGALDFKHAERGVFITTSSFTKEAQESIDKSSKRIILIDGNKLAELMIDYNVGVTVEDVYEVKKIDMDYFVEE